MSKHKNKVEPGGDAWEIDVSAWEEPLPNWPAPLITWDEPINNEKTAKDETKQ
jgi:hypothetical protein